VFSNKIVLGFYLVEFIDSQWILFIERTKFTYTRVRNRNPTINFLPGIVVSQHCLHILQLERKGLLSIAEAKRRQHMKTRL
jgi:hypothetical protein